MHLECHQGLRGWVWVSVQGCMDLCMCVCEGGGWMGGMCYHDFKGFYVNINLLK